MDPNLPDSDCASPDVSDAGPGISWLKLTKVFFLAAAASAAWSPSADWLDVGCVPGDSKEAPKATDWFFNRA